MTPFDLILTVALSIWAGWSLCTLYRKRFASSAASTPSEPRIVVNVPPDWKPLDTLPPTQIEGAKATLYWTVFRAALHDPYGDSESATEAAQEAVDKVFGPLEP